MYTLTAALGLSALGAGAIHLPILAPFALLVTTSAVVLALRGERSEEHTQIPLRSLIAGGTWFLLALYSLLQCMPLPRGLVESLAPDNADIWARALRPFGLPAPDKISISLAPGRTLLEAVKAASYALIFWAAARHGRRFGINRMAAVGFAVPFLVALVTTVHRLSGAERLYGIYPLLDAYSVAPLLNANSRAGFLNLGFFCGLGLLQNAGARPRAALLGLALTFVAAEVVLCESRGASGCLLLGLVLILAAPRRSESTELGRPLQISVLCAIGAGAALLAWGARRSPLGLDDRSLGKFDLWARSWHLALDHAGVGIGRGAFASVFSASQGTAQPVLAEHGENFPLQWAAEWGLPIALLALLTLAWALAPVIFRRRVWTHSTQRGVLVGCIVLLSQNFVDLGLELPAVSALLAFLLGGLSGSVLGKASSERGPRLRWVLVAGSAVSALCVALALKFAVESPARMRRELHDELVSTSGVPNEDFWAQLKTAMLAYPAEPYFPLLGASAALGEGKNAVAWIGRALERNRTSTQAYLLLGRILHARGATDQALGAFRHAIELDPNSTAWVLELVTHWKLSQVELEQIVPDGAAGARVLLSLAYQTSDIPLRVSILERALERKPNFADAHHQLATELLADLRRGGEVCGGARQSCLERALNEARQGAMANSSRTAVLTANIRRELGEGASAEQQLARDCQEFVGDHACAEALVDLALANNSEHLPEAIHGWTAIACVDRERCAAAELSLGRKLGATDRWNMALTHFERAAREMPSVETWRAIADTAQRVGQKTLAHDALRHLQLLGAGTATPPAPESSRRDAKLVPETSPGE